MNLRFLRQILKLETDELTALKHQMECLRKENACLKGEVEILKGRQESHNF